MAERVKDLLVHGNELSVPVTIVRAGKGPLLVVHDGEEYAERTNLLHNLDDWVAADDIPPINVALLSPDTCSNYDRLNNYGALPDYQDVLRRQVLPDIMQHVPVNGPVLGLGGSMGALALLHSASVFDGLFLQSTSIHHDIYETGVDYPALYAKLGHPQAYPRVKQFVEDLWHYPLADHTMAITMTCSEGETNYAGNKDMFHKLKNQGHSMVGSTVEGERHYHESWGGDFFEPHLKEFITRAIKLERERRSLSVAA